MAMRPLPVEKIRDLAEIVPGFVERLAALAQQHPEVPWRVRLRVGYEVDKAKDGGVEIDVDAPLPIAEDLMPLELQAQLRRVLNLAGLGDLDCEVQSPAWAKTEEA